MSRISSSASNSQTPSIFITAPIDANSEGLDHALFTSVDASELISTTNSTAYQENITLNKKPTKKPSNLQINSSNKVQSTNNFQLKYPYSEVSIQNEYLSFYNLKPFIPILQNELLLEKVGKPLNFTISSNIAIGTNLGKICIIDFDGNILAILAKQNLYLGLVSSLQFSIDGSRIVAGYSEGYIVVWTWENPTVEVIITPRSKSSITENEPTAFHLKSHPITHVCFVGRSRHRFISADTKGNLFHHQIISKVVLSKVKSIFMFNNLIAKPIDYKGISFLIDVAALPRGPISSPVDKFGVLAALYSDSFIVFQTQPRIEIIYKKSLTLHAEKKSDLGSISWLPSNHIYSIQTYNSIICSTSDKVSVFYLDDTNLNTKIGKITIKPFFEWEARSEINIVQWINPLNFLAITSDNAIYVIDICNKVESKVFSLSTIQLLSQPWLAADSGLDIAGTFRYSFANYKNSQYILAKNNIYTFNLRTWQERILWLMDEGRFIEVITLCTGLYKGDTGQPVFGLPPSSKSLISLHNIKSLSPDSESIIANLDTQREFLVGPKLATLIQASLKFLFSAKYDEISINTAQNDTRDFKSTKRLALLNKVYRTVNISTILASLLLAIIEACVATKKLDFLFKDIFEQVCIYSEAELIFLETLEPFIENGIISVVSPQVLQSLVKCYSENSSSRKKLEECLIYINLKPQGGILTFDIDGILSVCYNWRMWKASCRIWVDILNDSVTPLNQITDHISLSLNNRILYNGISSIRSDDWYLEEKLVDEFKVLFAALESCLCGKMYPIDSPRQPLSLAQKICVETLEWMLKQFSIDKKLLKSPTKNNHSSSQTPRSTFSNFEPMSDYNNRFYKDNCYLNQENNYHKLEKTISTKSDQGLNYHIEHRNTDLYHILKILFAFNTHKTLSVLNNAMNSEFIEQIVLVMPESSITYIGGIPNQSDSPKFIKSAKKVKSATQATADALLEFLQINSKPLALETVNEASYSQEYNPEQSFWVGREKLGLIACFLAQIFVSKYPLIYFPDATDNFLTRVLLQTSTLQTLNECENALENLLKICSPFSNTQELIEMVKKSGFYRVLGVLYKSTSQLPLVIQTYFDDHNSNRKKLVFNEIFKLFSASDEEYSQQAKANLTNFIKQNLDKLFNINPLALIILAENHTIEGFSHKYILQIFSENLEYASLEFKYLDIVFNLKYLVNGKMSLNELSSISLNGQDLEQLVQIKNDSEGQHFKYGYYEILLLPNGRLFELDKLPLDQLQIITEKFP
ncbi:hypothetical protein BB561_006366 [Smittium simulii]|uniref:Vacuolar protein sorting-associated protein 8 central domain-containing protein n=1 Tax=Smittium simulii TaxID=133385 RepID=A0A2T9Y527_9FUNG|nr:hypothetical protein BB561_006366 [Smittium simulii]